ncbi:importin subunit alpha-4-like [Artemia franciscana]|uniref:Uncharacterized protein n=1 Tax=Artemia franciscana TaxID=6661 RepID=A0AA88L4W0_ARTSF|nr:hypothetical protein QYM36_015662 [Artemia franciscana]
MKRKSNVYTSESADQEEGEVSDSDQSEDTNSEASEGETSDSDLDFALLTLPRKKKKLPSDTSSSESESETDSFPEESDLDQSEDSEIERRRDVETNRDEKRRDVEKAKKEEILFENKSLQELSGPFKLACKTLHQVANSAPTGDPESLVEAIRSVGDCLTFEELLPLDIISQSGILPVLVKALKTVENPNLQLEAAWVLTEIAKGTSAHKQAVFESGAVPTFIELLKSSHPNVSKLAVLALGNFASFNLIIY